VFRAAFTTVNKKHQIWRVSQSSPLPYLKSSVSLVPLQVLFRDERLGLDYDTQCKYWDTEINFYKSDKGHKRMAGNKSEHTCLEKEMSRLQILLNLKNSNPYLRLFRISNSLKYLRGKRGRSAFLEDAVQDDPSEQRANKKKVWLEHSKLRVWCWVGKAEVGKSKEHSPDMNSGKDTSWRFPQRGCTEVHPEVDYAQQEPWTVHMNLAQKVMPSEGLFIQMLYHLYMTSEKLRPSCCPSQTVWHFAWTTKPASTLLQRQFPQTALQLLYKMCEHFLWKQKAKPRASPTVMSRPTCDFSSCEPQFSFLLSSISLTVETALTFSGKWKSLQ